jgi:hypothetical protein
MKEFKQLVKTWRKLALLAKETAADTVIENGREDMTLLAHAAGLIQRSVALDLCATCLEIVIEGKEKGNAGTEPDRERLERLMWP